MLKKDKLRSLFQEKRYSELIFLIESSFINKPPEILNILAVSRLLKEKNKNTFNIAINEFHEVYLKEKKTENGLNGLVNFLNSASDFYDYLGNQDESNAATNFLKEGIILFKEAEINFKYNVRLVSSAIRVFKRLNNINSILNYYKKLFDHKNITLRNFCSWVFFNNYKNDWQQKDYLKNSKILDSYITKIPDEKLCKIIKNNDKKIKLGFLSSDINSAHSITFFLKTILKSYNKKNYEIHLILNNKIDDEGTEAFKKLVDGSINISALNDEAAINLIRKKNIDIIFDLMGLTSANRIAIFKNRVAPIQVSWLGYCNTLGIKNMDYLISDPNLIYQNELNLYSEKIIFLPKIWNCHSGFNFSRTNSVSPFQINKFITFGSFNNYNKINHNVVNVWSKILKNIKDSKLILKSSTKKEIDNLKNLFDQNGVIKSVKFLPTNKSFYDHINLYKKIDIALDTFPYNGVTTSFESIWMGVPVLTMKGFNFNSRCGESINKNIGMNQLIAENESDYIAKALNLNKDFDKLLKIREKIFSEATSSPLFDISSFSKHFFNLINKIHNK